jgi:WD40 repeat protein
VSHQWKDRVYNDAEYDFEYDIVLACTTDNKLCCFGDKGSAIIYEIDVSPCCLTRLLIIKKLRVALFGTTTGGVRMYLWPFDFTLKNQEFSETPVHQGKITALSVTPDLNYLITGSDDGSVYFLKMKEFVDGHEQAARNMSIGIEAQYYCLNSLTMTSNSTTE